MSSVDVNTRLPSPPVEPRQVNECNGDLSQSTSLLRVNSGDNSLWFSVGVPTETFDLKEELDMEDAMRLFTQNPAIPASAPHHADMLSFTKMAMKQTVARFALRFHERLSRRIVVRKGSGLLVTSITEAKEGGAGRYQGFRLRPEQNNASLEG
jgi:hypothetical protein